MLIGSTATNELLGLDIKTGERKRVVKDIIDPYHLGFSPDGKWFVTAAYRLDHVDIFHADGFRLAGRIFIDGLPSHMAFDAESKTVFVTLQQSGRLAAFDLQDADAEMERCRRQHARRVSSCCRTTSGCSWR